MIIAGTGHRPPTLFKENPYSFANKSKLIDFIVDIIDNLESDGIFIERIISGLAQGWDNCLAHAAIEVEIPLLAAMPFKGMEKNWPKAAQKDYEYILTNAEKIVLVSEGGYSNHKFFLRDKYMVDNCDLLLALYSGISKSGTGITIEYAKTQNKVIKNYWEDWINV